MKVPFINKQVNANTQYRQLTNADQRLILDQCKNIVDVVDVCINMGHPEDAANLTRNDPFIPRQGTGKSNSCYSMCAGVLDNFNKGQYNLSDKQCNGLERAFTIANKEINGIEEIEFEEVTSLPKLSPPKVAPVSEVPTLMSSAVFSDLFDVESITITYRKK